LSNFTGNAPQYNELSDNINQYKQKPDMDSLKTSADSSEEAQGVEEDYYATDIDNDYMNAEVENDLVKTSGKLSSGH